MIKRVNVNALLIVLQVPILYNHNDEYIKYFRENGLCFHFILTLNIIRNSFYIAFSIKYIKVD